MDRIAQVLLVVSVIAIVGKLGMVSYCIAEEFYQNSKKQSELEDEKEVVEDKSSK